MAHNVKATVKGNVLTIVCDISPAAIASAKDSATGKTKLVASTGGSEKIDGHDGMSFSINVMQKN